MPPQEPSKLRWEPAPKRSWLDFIQDPTYAIREKLRAINEEEAGPEGWLPSDLLGLFSQNYESPEGFNPAVTKYLTRGIPDIAAREFGTASFKKKLVEELGPEWADIADEVVKKFPRVSAHVSPYRSFDNSIRGIAKIEEPLNNARRKVKVGLNPRTMDDSVYNSYTGPDNPYESTTVSKLLDNQRRDTLYHELGHVSQRLGGGERMPEAYSQSLDAAILKGDAPSRAYFDNPFEVSARNIAARKAPNAEKNRYFFKPENYIPEPEPAYKGLVELAAATPDDSSNPISAKSILMDWLQRRLNP